MGNTVIIVEHDRETIESADFTVELGPKAGNDGGKVIFAGSVKDMKKCKNSLTGKYLSKKKIIPINTNPFFFILSLIVLKLDRLENNLYLF